MGDHVSLVSMVPEPPHILDQLALVRHQRIIDGNDPAPAVARLGRLLQPGQPAIVQRRDVPLDFRQPAVEARLVRREGKFPVDATHRLVFGYHQTGQIFRKVPAGGLRVEQITKNHERFVHDGGKVHNSGHRDRLLSTMRTYSVIDGLSMLRGATDFAKLQLLQGKGLTKEVAVGTVIQDTQQRNYDRQPRWDRFERADLFAQYRALRAQGMSQRQVAQELQVPRTTLQAWRTWHDTLDICPDVAQFFQSGPGLACVHRLVMAFHLVCIAVGACGMRLACLFLTLSGLDRFVAASYGAQQQVNCQVEAAMVTYRQTATARLAKDMPRKDITVTQDETFTGGLVTMDPDSNFILLEQLAQARDQTSWNALMAPALAQLNCRVIQSTSDEAPGLLAYVEHYLEAHHSPDLFHVQHELVKAVSGPMATKERAAHKAVTEAREQLERVQPHPQSAGDEPQKCGPGRPPQEL